MTELSSEVRKRYEDGFMCAQAVLSTYGPRYGLSEETAGRLSCGMGGGMSWPGQVCGAVNAAVLVIGLALSNGTTEDEFGRLAVQEAVDTFIDRFESEFGDKRCKSLLGDEIMTPEGYDAVRNHDGFNRKCPEVLEAVARMLEDLIE